MSLGLVSASTCSFIIFSLFIKFIFLLSKNVYSLKSAFVCIRCRTWYLWTDTIARLSAENMNWVRHVTSCDVHLYSPHRLYSLTTVFPALLVFVRCVSLLLTPVLASSCCLSSRYRGLSTGYFYVMTSPCAILVTQLSGIR